MTRGCGWVGSLRALRNSRLAAAASRSAAQQEVDGGSRGVDGPIEVAPAALHLLSRRHLRIRFGNEARIPPLASLTIDIACHFRLFVGTGCLLAFHHAIERE